jgi:cholesterol oxidase
MSHDSADGVIELENDRARITWPGIGATPVFKKANEKLEEATKPLEGTYVRNPAWSGFTNNNLITVHPLGGCIMGADAGAGVVNHKGQVFSGESGTETYEGLYVCDGAVIPLALGVNPFLTISALAERMCTLIAQDRGWQIDYSLPSQPRTTPQAAKPGLKFTETMRGYISTSFPGDFEKSYADGKEKGLAFQFTLTIATEDVNAMLTDPKHQARMVGTVEAPTLSGQPLTVTNGIFNLFVTDPNQVGVRQMWYRMPMTSVEGTTYFMTGFKEIHDDRRLDVWPD